MSPVRLPDDDDLRTPLFRNGAPRRKSTPKAPSNPPREPLREEDAQPPDDPRRIPKEDDR
jgi:hypothetical protein